MVMVIVLVMHGQWSELLSGVEFAQCPDKGLGGGRCKEWEASTVPLLHYSGEHSCNAVNLCVGVALCQKGT